MMAASGVADRPSTFTAAQVPKAIGRVRPLRILLVEDSVFDAEAVAGSFELREPGSFAVTLERAERVAAAQRLLSERRYDLVLLDLSLPDATDLDALNAVVEQHPDVPVVVMTTRADDQLAVEALKAGAQDVLVKGEEDARSVRRAVRNGIERHRLLRHMADLLHDERDQRTAAERAARARDEMLAIVSHDLRNPLSAISFGAASLASARSDQIPHIAEIIDRSTRSAVHIIRDLLDISAIEAGRLSCYRERMLTQVIAEQVVTTFAAQASHAGIALSVEVEGAPRWVDIDVDRIVQAVGNLVANAIKFTPRRGSIAVRCLGGPSGELRVEVSDTGAGVPAEQLPFIFDRFWQGKARRGGAGLGLAIARGIAVSHGGTIEVLSEVGAGSTFTLVIPAAAPAPGSEPEGAGT
jgi:signal transduction histidine kinase